MPMWNTRRMRVDSKGLEKDGGADLLMATGVARAAVATMLAAVLTVMLAPASTAAYDLGGSPHAASGTASARTARVMETAPRMARTSTAATQRGTYAAGSRITLVCYRYGGEAFGRGSANIAGGFSKLWYRVSDGFFVADVHLDTGSNRPVTNKCPLLNSNVNVSTSSWQQITAKRTGAHVAIKASKARDGVSVRPLRATGASTQKFRFVRDVFGNYRIVSATSRSQVVTVRGGASASDAGAGVVTKKWRGLDSQRWLVRKVPGTGDVTLRPMSNPRLCLTVPKSGTARLTVASCGKKGQWFNLDSAGTASTYVNSVTNYYRATYGASIAAPGGKYRGICHGLTENFMAKVYGIEVDNLGDYVPGGGDGAGKLTRRGLTWHATKSAAGLRTGDIAVFRSRTAGALGHVGIWYEGRLYDQNNHTRGYFETARVSPYPVSGMQLVGYWRG
ncbi:RICIN domain-containing protein [Demequina iriomotensis]|uniref:RICIN domain-containing protein n=1 Tax=Demequina iriomotensis TaxID=1536641 RepID=UPI00147054F2|nr:RICIN domain-containing protein [Demequina iriomotensis]